MNGCAGLDDAEFELAITGEEIRRGERAARWGEAEGTERNLVDKGWLCEVDGGAGVRPVGYGWGTAVCEDEELGEQEERAEEEEVREEDEVLLEHDEDEGKVEEEVEDEGKEECEVVTGCDLGTN